MKNINKLPRILKIVSIEGYLIACVFNSGETRTINFGELFKKWKIKKSDPENILLNRNEFKKVSLRNQTLSWKNVKIKLTNMEGKVVEHPYEIGPDVLYEASHAVKVADHKFHFGKRIREIRLQKGLTQEELAKRSGTSKTYISRVENNQIEPEFTTLYKIVEIGLGRRIRVEIG